MLALGLLQFSPQQREHGIERALDLPVAGDDLGEMFASGGMPVEDPLGNSCTGAGRDDHGGFPDFLIEILHHFAARRVASQRSPGAAPLPPGASELPVPDELSLVFCSPDSWAWAV